MEFFISYNIEYNRVLSGIILENRQAITQTKDKTGFQVKTFIDGQIGLVDDTTIPYILETAQGNLAAFFSLKVVGVEASTQQLFIRKNFAQFGDDISLKISSFISTNDWRTDLL